MQMIHRKRSLDINMRDTKKRSYKNPSVYWIASVTFVSIMAALYIFRLNCCQEAILNVFHFKNHQRAS